MLRLAHSFENNEQAQIVRPCSEQAPNSRTNQALKERRIAQKFRLCLRVNARNVNAKVLWQTNTRRQNLAVDTRLVYELQ